MPTERKYPTVWEVLHPGEPLPSPEEFDEMQERAVEYFRQRLEEDPSLFDHYDERRCTCCEDSRPSDDRSALPD